MKGIIGSVLSIFILLGFVSCNEDDDFSSDPGLRLSFSADTVSFDTVFTDIGSSRRTLMIYNNNNKSVTISAVKLMNPEKSGFSMAVDGVSGNEVRDVDLLKEDSAYVFVMVRVNPHDSDNPMIIRDSIQFEINGQYQYVQLAAIGQDVYLWKAKTIAQDTILTGERPFLIYDSLVINKNVTLNLKENVRMYFHDKAGVKVLGTINAKGTREEPVIFRGDRTDNLSPKWPYDNIPGQWEGMIVDSLSFNNYFEHFHLRNSVNGIIFNPSNTTATKAAFKDAIIRNTQSDGITAQNCIITGENSLFANAGGTVMKLIGGQYDFLHCTLANYMAWVGSSSKTALTIGNNTNDNRSAPLTKCNFTNSIIAESINNAIRFQKSDNESITFNHLFTNCLIKMNGSDDANFVNTIWREDPVFININNDGDYFYNFNLDAESPAIGKADIGRAYTLPIDLSGNSRIQDGAPDIGCYEYIKIED